MEPLYGLLTTLLVVYGLAADVSSNLVVVLPEKVNAVQGKKITLSCRIEAVPDLKLIQCSWERQLPSGKEIMAVFHSEYGTSIPAELANRVSFVTASAQDVSITLDVVNLADIGSYTCKVSTFPLGNAQASTYVNVLVEPKVYVSAGPAALLEGESESLVATCIAERGRPAAEVSWETELRGREETQSHDEPDGTASVHVRYMWEPHSSAQGKTLTCVVRHPALQTEFRIPYTLNIQFAPMVFIKGGEKNWYAGQTDVTIICGAQANPPVREYTWVRLDGQMPENVNIVTNRFAFTRPLELNDSGVYRCEATNDVGVRSHDLSIWVQGPSPPPSESTADRHSVQERLCWPIILALSPNIKTWGMRPLAPILLLPRPWWSYVPSRSAFPSPACCRCSEALWFLATHFSDEQRRSCRCSEPLHTVWVQFQHL
ncbi:nectin-3-like protein isoform X4 [Phyllopteryx taeniolatus]|uniref:nectin-3-like protein isoform X4 n=1 Tax=Phyllopteryx taeniolatus TaxID=161469 RepID=UPI002AD4F2EC|nr:nectin-3-like protein isoform X4 [Phyllopteryx taeniolatus]